MLSPNLLRFLLSFSKPNSFWNFYNLFKFFLNSKELPTNGAYIDYARFHAKNYIDIQIVGYIVAEFIAGEDLRYHNNCISGYKTNPSMLNTALSLKRMLYYLYISTIELRGYCFIHFLFC